jgi:hypothetical protein
MQTVSNFGTVKLKIEWRECVGLVRQFHHLSVQLLETKSTALMQKVARSSGDIH